MEATVYIGTSLDGFIARENGDIDWLTDGSDQGTDEAKPTDSAEDYGYEEFFATVDALVMGRGTYDKVLTFGEWPYGDKPVIVLTSRPLDRPTQVPGTVESMSCSPAECVARLEARGMRHLYVDGGKTIQSFLRAGLITRLIITRLPVLIGRGIPLFGPLDRDVKLRHVTTRSFPNGFVQSEYEVV